MAEKQCFSGKVGAELCPDSIDDVSFHTQVTLSGLLTIPLQKPPKEKIFNTTHEINITKCTAITVTMPPGKKVLIVGNFMAGVEYIAATPDQKVHFAHWDLPFQALIKNDDGTLLDLNFDLNNYIVHVCIEHEEYHQVDERTIAYEVVLLIWLEEIDP